MLAGMGVWGQGTVGPWGVSGHKTGGVLEGAILRVADRLVRAGSSEVTPRTKRRLGGTSGRMLAGSRWDGRGSGVWSHEGDRGRC